MILSRSPILATLFAVTACGGASRAAPIAPPSAAEPQTTAAEKPQPPMTPPAVTAEAPKPMMTLTETPAEKLGTAPASLGLKMGTKAPDATLPDVTGKTQRLAKLYGEGPTFVVFYRGGWCPFCNLQLHDLMTAKPDFDKRGLRIVAISVDLPNESAKTQAKQGVLFPMLSDGNLAAHKAFHIVHVPSDTEAKALVGYGVDLEKYSGQSHHSFAVPSIFLVDKTGVVRWVHVDEDYKTRPSPKQMLEVAERALKK